MFVYQSISRINSVSFSENCPIGAPEKYVYSYEIGHDVVLFLKKQKGKLIHHDYDWDTSLRSRRCWKFWESCCYTEALNGRRLWSLRFAVNLTCWWLYGCMDVLYVHTYVCIRMHRLRHRVEGRGKRGSTREKERKRKVITDQGRKAPEWSSELARRNSILYP